MRRADIRVGMHVAHDTTGRYLGQVAAVKGVAVRLDRGEKPLATCYEIRKATQQEIDHHNQGADA